MESHFGQHEQKRLRKSVKILIIFIQNDIHLQCVNLNVIFESKGINCCIFNEKKIESVTHIRFKI